MSVSATTSRALQQALGEEAADEMIDRINQFEQSRADQRELIDLRFDRFEDRLARQFSEFEATIDKRFTDVEAKVDKRFNEFEAKVDKRFAEQDVKIEKIRAELLKWMFLSWIAGVGMILGFVRLLPP